MLKKGTKKKFLINLCVVFAVCLIGAFSALTHLFTAQKASAWGWGPSVQTATLDLTEEGAFENCSPSATYCTSYTREEMSAWFGLQSVYERTVLQGQDGITFYHQGWGVYCFGVQLRDRVVMSTVQSISMDMKFDTTGRTDAAGNNVADLQKYEFAALGATGEKNIVFSTSDLTFGEWTTLKFEGDNLAKLTDEQGYFQGFQYTSIQLTGVPHINDYMRSITFEYEGGYKVSYVLEEKVLNFYGCTEHTIVDSDNIAFLCWTIGDQVYTPGDVIQVKSDMTFTAKLKNTVTKSMDFLGNISTASSSITNYNGIDNETFKVNWGIDFLNGPYRNLYCGVNSIAGATNFSALAFTMFPWSAFKSGVILFDEPLHTSIVTDVSFRVYMKSTPVEGKTRNGLIDLSLYSPGSDGSDPVYRFNDIYATGDNDNKWMTVTFTREQIVKLADEDGWLTGFVIAGYDLTGAAPDDILYIDYFQFTYLPEEVVVDYDYPEEVYEKDDNNPVVIDFDVNSFVSTNVSHLKEHKGVALENYALAETSKGSGTYKSVKYANQNTAYAMNVPGGQLTMTYAMRFAYKLNVSDFDSLVLRTLYTGKKVADDGRELTLYAYDSSGAYGEGVSVNLEQCKQNTWVNIVLDSEQLSKIADKKGYISGLQIVFERKDMSSIVETLYLDYIAYSEVEGEKSIISFNDEASSDFEELEVVRNYLTDGTTSLDGTVGTLQWIDGENKLADITEFTDQPFEQVDLESAYMGKAYKLSFNPWAQQRTSNYIPFANPVHKDDITSLTIRIWAHFNTQAIYSSGGIFFYGADMLGWQGIGYTLPSISQDQWVNLNISGRQLDAFADADGMIRGLQIGSRITSTSDDLFYQEGKGYLLIDYVSYDKMYTLTFEENANVQRVMQVEASGLKDYYYIPQRSGYVFAGWYLNDELFNFSSTLTEDTVLTAKWVKMDSLKKAKGLYVSETTGNRVMIFANGSVDLSDMLNSYQVLGISDSVLYVNSNYKVKQFNLNTTFKPAEYVTVTWKIANSNVLEFIEKSTAAAERIVQRNGYTFVKWTNVDGSDVDFSNVLNSDTTFVSVWEYQEVADYTDYLGKYYNETTYDYVELGADNNVVAYTSQFAFIGKYYILNNYAIVFVSEDTVFEGTFFDIGLIQLGNVYLEPTQDTAKVVSFDTKGGTKVQNALIVDGKVAMPSNPSKVGYAFEKWLLNDVEFDFNTQLDESTILTASWVADANFNPDLLTVLFDTNGGSSINYVQVTEGGTIIQPANPTKEGYVFVEWQYNGVRFDFADEVTEDMTLVAIWQLASDTVYVFFNTDGGSEIQSIVVIDGVFEMPANPTKEGYVFAGWYYEDGTQYNAGDYIRESTTLYARWTKIAGGDGDRFSPTNVGCGGCGSVLGATGGMSLLVGVAICLLFVLNRKSKEE